MGDIFCVQCGRYHQSLSFCPNEQPEPIVIGRADFGQSEQVAALERELAACKEIQQDVIDGAMADLNGQLLTAQRELAAKDARIGELVEALQYLTVRKPDMRTKRMIVMHGGEEHELGHPCRVCAALDAVKEKTP